MAKPLPCWRIASSRRFRPYLRLIQIPNATRVVLNAFVENSIRPEKTTVFTGCLGLLQGAGQARDRPSAPQGRPRGRQALNLLPWAHSVFGNLETWLRGTFHGVSPKHLQRYLDELSYRFDPPLARGRALRLRPAPCGARPAPSLPATRGGGNGIGRGVPIRGPRPRRRDESSTPRVGDAPWHARRRSGS